jgi:hypothetical protein
MCILIGAAGKRAVVAPTADWDAISKTSAQLQDLLREYLDASTGRNVAAAQSVETDLLTEPMRADETYGAGERPLRLLSLGQYFFPLSNSHLTDSG